MNRLDRCLPLYIGCETSDGQLIGVKDHSLFIQSKEQNSSKVYANKVVGVSLFLYLRKLSALTPAESVELNAKGFNIGRPKGYSFSPGAFLYLLSLHVDLFGLIEFGLAKEIP
jgi:hypothetical protein